MKEHMEEGGRVPTAWTPVYGGERSTKDFNDRTEEKIGFDVSKVCWTRANDADG